MAQSHRWPLSPAKRLERGVRIIAEDRHEEGVVERLVASMKTQPWDSSVLARLQKAKWLTERRDMPWPRRLRIDFIPSTAA